MMSFRFLARMLCCMFVTACLSGYANAKFVAADCSDCASNCSGSSNGRAQCLTSGGRAMYCK